jgi:hypothetical protein
LTSSTPLVILLEGQPGIAPRGVLTVIKCLILPSTKSISEMQNTYYIHKNCKNGKSTLFGRLTYAGTHLAKMGHRPTCCVVARRPNSTKWLWTTLDTCKLTLGSLPNYGCTKVVHPRVSQHPHPVARCLGSTKPPQTFRHANKHSGDQSHALI